MGFGKVLAIISGVLTLLATWITTWIPGGPYGIGAVMNLPDVFGALNGIEYLFLALEILLLLAFIIELIGIKVRFLAILGGLIPFVIGVFFILSAFRDIGFITNFVSNFTGVAGSTDALVEGIIPLDISFADMTVGAVVLTLSVLLGIISGFMKRDVL